MLLERLVPWQRERNFPIRFSTEASVNTSDDSEFMELMLQANFCQVFLGLESPRSVSLNETKKFQNTRGDSLVEKVTRVRDAGLVVTAGFIVGFDNDDERIFAEQYEFITVRGRLAPLRDYFGAAVVAVRLGNVLRRESKFRELVPDYVAMYARHVRTIGRRAIPLPQYVMLCAFHWHFYKMVHSHARFAFGNAQRPSAELATRFDRARSTVRVSAGEPPDAGNKTAWS